MSQQLVKLIAAAALVLSPALASAGVLGTTVTGGMYFGSNTNNYFNSSLGWVPGGCQNSGAGSASVVVVDPTAEFCFADGANTNTAQFTDTTLSVTDLVTGGAINWKMTFAFAPNTVLGVTETSDSFNNGGVNYSFVNDILTLTWAGTSSGGLNLNAMYTLRAAPTNDVPEPAPLALVALALLAAGAARYKRKA